MNKSFVSLRVICIDHPELLGWDSRGLYTCGEIVFVFLFVSPSEQVDISLTVVVEEDRFECQQDPKACEAAGELVDMAVETAYLLVGLENNALVN